MTAIRPKPSVSVGLTQWLSTIPATCVTNHNKAIFIQKKTLSVRYIKKNLVSPIMLLQLQTSKMSSWKQYGLKDLWLIVLSCLALFWKEKILWSSDAIVFLGYTSSHGRQEMSSRTSSSHELEGKTRSYKKVKAIHSEEIKFFLFIYAFKTTTQWKVYWLSIVQ